MLNYFRTIHNDHTVSYKLLTEDLKLKDLPKYDEFFNQDIANMPLENAEIDANDGNEGENIVIWPGFELLTNIPRLFWNDEYVYLSVLRQLSVSELLRDVRSSIGLPLNIDEGGGCGLHRYNSAEAGTAGTAVGAEDTGAATPPDPSTMHLCTRLLSSEALSETESEPESESEWFSESDPLPPYPLSLLHIAFGKVVAVLPATSKVFSLPFCWYVLLYIFVYRCYILILFYVVHVYNNLSRLMTHDTQLIIHDS